MVRIVGCKFENEQVNEERKNSLQVKYAFSLDRQRELIKI